MRPICCCGGEEVCDAAATICQLCNARDAFRESSAWYRLTVHRVNERFGILQKLVRSGLQGSKTTIVIIEFWVVRLYATISQKKAVWLADANEGR